MTGLIQRTRCDRIQKIRFNLPLFHMNHGPFLSAFARQHRFTSQRCGGFMELLDWLGLICGDEALAVSVIAQAIVPSGSEPANVQVFLSGKT
jgi:hypothetical protein